MSFGPTGLQTKSLSEIRAEMREEARSVFGPQIQTGTDTVLGKLIDVVALFIAQNGELTQAVYDSFRPAAAAGVNLDSIVSLRGIVREPARASQALLGFTGVNGTIIPAGSLYRVPDGPAFATLEDVTIAGGVAEVLADCTVTGPIEAVANSITAQVTIIAGVATVDNASDAVLGRDTETDTELRQRFGQSAQATGAATDPAIRAALLALTTVDQAVVISNRTLLVDAFGIPPKSFRAIVWPDPGAFPADQEIYEAIWEKQPAGIGSDGTRSATVTDSQGFDQVVSYSLATALPLTIEATLTTDPDFYPGDGDDQVAAAIEAYVSTLSIGSDFVNVTCLCAIVASVPGITSLTILATTTPPVTPADDQNIAADIDEIFTVDPVDITVVSS